MIGARRRRVERLTTRIDAARRAGDDGWLCGACADISGLSGAGIMLMAGDVQRGSLCTSDGVSAAIEELQFSFDEGPCLDAFRDDAPVIEPDLTGSGRSRWPSFAPRAAAAGAAAVFGFPIAVGVVRLGALNLYRSTAGVLSGEQFEDCLALASIAGTTMIELQAQAPEGTLAPGLEAGANLELRVHQAIGMVAAQAEVDVANALAMLRAHALDDGQTLRSVALDVVARELDFRDGRGIRQPRWRHE